MLLTEQRVDARPIATVRIGIGLANLLIVLETYVLLRGIADGKVAMPVGPWSVTPTDGAVSVYLLLGVVGAVALTLGHRASTAALVIVLLNIGVFLWDQQTYSSHRLLATLLLAYLVFARAGAVWSMTGKREGSTVPWWPQFLMMTQLSVCYLFAAVSKINPVFLEGGALQGWVRWTLPGWVVVVAAVGTVATELFLALALWFRSTRLIAAVLGVALHTSILVMLRDNTLELVAFALLCVPLYLLFLSRPQQLWSADRLAPQPSRRCLPELQRITLERPSPATPDHPRRQHRPARRAP